MINFQSLRLKINTNHSFVGIQKQDNSLYLCLPKGFDNQVNKDNQFNQNKEIFFLFYKIFDAFKKICADKGYLDKVDEFGKKDRDGVIKSTRGSGIEDDGDDSENIFYSKLDIIGSLLDVYDEPKILSLAYRLGRSDEFDVSQIHKYLHQAVYLPNNAAYVDQMLLPKKILQFESTDIVSMYCYLFCEVKLQLKESVSTETTSLSERFREKYLRSGDSLFDEQTYEQVLDILKDALETIDHNTPIKDADYWQYYEAIELFLYGDLNKQEDGEIWGVSNFHSVWESMCLNYIAQTTNPSLLLHLDSKYVTDRLMESTKISPLINLSNKFDLLNTKLNPDAVIFSPLLSQVKVKTTHYKICDDIHNDYGYKTTFKGIGFKNSKIAFIGQKEGKHTLEKLQEVYPSSPISSRFSSLEVEITFPLPKKEFYSFWTIPEVIDPICLHKMYYFNHLFCIALEKNILDWDSFFKEILSPPPIELVFNISYKDPRTNVFNLSIFRDESAKSLKESFNNFIQQISNLYRDLLEVIDVKYLTSNYFCDSRNLEEIKQKSVRKQFVYEYLIQKELEKRQDKLSNLSIQSSFWLPSYRPDDSNLIEDGETFMDGYIQLKNINFAVLAENYIA